MKCETIEQLIILILEGREPEKEVKEHIKKCASCKGFYEYINELKEEFTNITEIEPSPDFEDMVLRKILKEPVYGKVFAFLMSSLTFVFIIFIPYFLKSFFPEIIITFSKIMVLCNIFSKVFNFNLCYIIPPFVFIFILTNLFILYISFFLLKKITFKEVRL